MSIIKSIEGTNITVTAIGGHPASMDLSEIFQIDADDLSKEFSKQASIYGFFAMLVADAEHRAAVKSLEKDQEYAVADLEYREEYKGEKTTEGFIKSMVMADKTFDRISKEELEARYDHKLLKAITAALEMRAEMLISLGAHMRHEMDQTGMKIKENTYDHLQDQVKDLVRNAKGKQV